MSERAKMKPQFTAGSPFGASGGVVVPMPTPPKPTPDTSQEVSDNYQPTKSEQRTIDAWQERVKTEKAARAPRLKVDGNGRVTVDHPDEGIGGTLLMDALGVTNLEFGHTILSNLVEFSTNGRRADERQSNAALATIMSIGPRDPVETLLATQRDAIHAATITMARRFSHTETIQQQDAAERALNKLARTFAAQVDTLKRYRSKGEQRVYVERVNVSEGGQAIVGNVETGGRGGAKKKPSTPCTWPRGATRFRSARDVPARPRP